MSTRRFRCVRAPLLEEACHGTRDRTKQVRAQSLFRETAQNNEVVVSTQVIQEFYVVGSRKLNLPRMELRERVGDLLSLNAVVITGAYCFRS